jgi:hypothetical protein
MGEWGKYVILFQEAKSKSKSHKPFTSPKSRFQLYQNGVFKSTIDFAKQDY